MAIIDEIEAQLEIMNNIHDEIGVQLQKWHDLSSVADARKAYEECLKEEEEKLAHLDRCIKSLKRDLHWFTYRFQIDEVPEETLPTKAEGREEQEITKAFFPPPRPVKPPVRRANEGTGKQFREWARRWSDPLGLDAESIGEINRITIDPNAHIAEALLIPDWESLTDYGRTRTPPEKYLQQCIQWHDILSDYRDQLARKIATEEIRWGGWIKVWEIWRNPKPIGKDIDWDKFIERSRSEKKEQIQGLEHEIEELKKEIEHSKEQSPDI